MNDSPDIDIESAIPPHAVSVLGEENADDFPVLKAFQQYINAEQEKARKRLITLCIFFGCLMAIVVTVFLLLLNGVSRRNEVVNDRLLDYMMQKENGRQSAVVVQPPQDNSAMLGLISKMDEMQKKFNEAQAKVAEAEQARVAADAKAAADVKAAELATKTAVEKARIKEELEIARLKAELAAERKKAAEERERQKQEELEAYRRKYYPELYEKKPQEKKPAPAVVAPKMKNATAKDEDVDALLDELNAAGPVNYFEEDDDDDAPLPKVEKIKVPEKKPDSYKIPVDVKGTKVNWKIPNK